MVIILNHGWIKGKTKESRRDRKKAAVEMTRWTGWISWHLRHGRQKPDRLNRRGWVLECATPILMVHSISVVRERKQGNQTRENR